MLFYSRICTSRRIPGRRIPVQQSAGRARAAAPGVCRTWVGQTP